MKKTILYPSRPIVGQDFSKVKKQTIPNQSLSLKDIIKRFIRKESLPIGNDGIYAENLGDLEKIAREDITQRMERADHLSDSLEKVRKHQKAKAETPPAGGSGPPATGEGGQGAAPATSPPSTI